MNEILESTLSDKGKELQLLLEEQKTQEFYYRVGQLKSKLPTVGRCTICTLKIPCKHYSSMAELPKLEESIIETPSLTSAIQGLTVEKLPEKLQKDRSYTVRYRGRDTKYSDVSKERQSSLPNSQKLKTLEKIEEYREEKIKKEIEKIKTLKEIESIKLREDKIADEKRRKHALQLKLRIEQYKEDYQMKREQVKIYLEQEKHKKLKEEEKRKKYLELKRKELADYIERKNIIEKIERQKIIELQDHIENFKKP